MTTTDPRPRSVARDARADRPPAEQIADLLGELYDEVRTEASVLRYRTVRRGRRHVAIPDWVIHRTREAGLIRQARAAAVPGGSPGWDEDGALSPLTGGASHESAEPVTDAFHLEAEVDAELVELEGELRDAGHRGGLVSVAAADPALGERIAGRVRALVNRARIVLGYDAPIVPLRDMYCRHCGGELRVRADASSGVWCAGVVTLHGPAVEGAAWPIRVRCGAHWPRGSWVALLEHNAPWQSAPPERVTLAGTRDGTGGRA